MKFRKVSLSNHPILGNVNFDFTDKQGRTVDTIIIAGENGTGKSVLLSLLNSYNPLLSAKQLGYSMRVEVELSADEISSLSGDKDFVNMLGNRFTGNVISFIQDTSFRDDNPRVEFESKSGGKEIDYAFQFAKNPSLYKTIFSDVEINFTPNNIQHTTSTKLDIDYGSSVRSPKNLATEITQLLVDINELDNEDLAKWVDSNKGQVPTDEVLHKRIRRFTRAFDKMFPNKHFVGVDNIDNRKTVLFEEFGKKMEIAQLSSGEKQIVFRGGFLIRDLGAINGATILVDEPELSLHPQWQLKILNFLKGLFTDGTGNQTSQLIVATHSPFILHNNTRANDKVIVLQKDECGKVKILDKPEFYNWATTSAVEDAFHVSPLLMDKKVIVFLEGETDELYFNKAMEVFGIDSDKISFNWIGHYSGGDKGKPENTGDKALNNAASFYTANPQMILDKKVYLLYDCDTNKTDCQLGNLFVGAMTNNSKASIYKIGVENLLVLPVDFNYQNFYKTSTRMDNYGAESIITDLNKSALADFIVKQPYAQLSNILENVKVEIEKVIKRTGI